MQGRICSIDDLRRLTKKNIGSSGCQEIPIRRYQTHNRQRPKSKHPVKSPSEYRDNIQWRKKAEAITTYLHTTPTLCTLLPASTYSTSQSRPRPSLHLIYLLPQATTIDPLSLSSSPNTAADIPYRIVPMSKEKEIDFDTGYSIRTTYSSGLYNPTCQCQPTRN
jgi:hypothetical protein